MYRRLLICRTRAGLGCTAVWFHQNRIGICSFSSLSPDWYKVKDQASSTANDFLTLGPLDGIIEFDDLLDLRLKLDIPAEFAGVLVDGCRLVRKRALIHGDIGILGNRELIVNRKLDRTGSEILQRNLIPSIFDLSSVQQSGFRSLAYKFL